MNCDNNMIKDKIMIIIMCNIRLNKYVKIECYNWLLDLWDNFLNFWLDWLMVVIFVVVFYKLNFNNNSKFDYCEKDFLVIFFFGYVYFMV